jgi:hypothetical protein
MTDRRFPLVFVVAGMLFLAGVIALLIGLDPYDTGRLTLFKRTGMFETGPRMVNASRMRDPSFDSAVLGNSTVQLLKPERLNALTGNRFVQLTVPGTGPMEQVAMLRRLVHEKGSGLKALTIGLEYSWCEAARETTTVNPFPFWLYDNNTFAYARGLIRFDTLEAMPRRLRLLFGKERRAAPDGFWDYEQISGGYNESIGKSVLVSDLPEPSKGRHSASEALVAALSLIPGNTAVVLLHPPTHVPAGHVLSSRNAERMARCKDELRQAAQQRPNTIIVDAWTDNPLTRDRTLFFDYNHYRSPLAMHVEAEIAKALATTIRP